MSSVQGFRRCRTQKEFLRETFALVPNDNKINLMALGIAIDLMRPADRNMMSDCHTIRGQYFGLVLQRYFCPVVEPLLCFQGSFGHQTLQRFERKYGENVQQVQFRLMLPCQKERALYRPIRAWRKIGGDNNALYFLQA